MLVCNITVTLYYFLLNILYAILLAIFENETNSSTKYKNANLHFHVIYVIINFVVTTKRSI